MKTATLCLVMSTLLLMFSSTVLGQAALVSDAHTSATSVSGNFGTNPALAVSSANAAYVRFDLSRSFPSGTSADDVATATVKFYVNKVATPGKLDMHPILADWNEKTIAYNNAPPVGQVVSTTQQIGKDSQGNYVVIDITALVKLWVGDGGGQNALPNFGFALAPHPVGPNTPELANVIFDSKENSQTSHDASFAAQLVQPPTGLTTVSRDATLTGDGTAANPLGVAWGAIDATRLAANSVTTDKIANGAVTEAKLGEESITGSKILTPLLLSGNSFAATLSVGNAGGGPSIKALGTLQTDSLSSTQGQRILGYNGTNNIFVGALTGAANTGMGNSFVGSQSGQSNASGQNNSFFGVFSGNTNTTGSGNAYFGTAAGRLNNGILNAIFGHSAGSQITGGNSNSLFGSQAGTNFTSGSDNTFIGHGAGTLSSTGSSNTFIGARAWGSDTVDQNTLLGNFARATGPLSFATAIGAHASVTQSNSLVLGAINGVNLATASTNVGIGTTAPKTRLHMASGKLYIDANGQGVVLKSPNGSCFELTVTDAGALTASAIACP